jgi:hypothetical protein
VTTNSITGTGTALKTVTCTTGKMVSGGFSQTGGSGNIVTSMPAANGWSVAGSAAQTAFTVYVVCANPG